MNQTFGHNVRRLRLQRGLSQVELAKQVGVWQTYISRIERGDTPSIEVAQRLARALGVTIDDLLAEQVVLD